MSENKENYDNIDMTFVIFLNDFKKEGKHPDYTGNVTIKGEKYKMSGWKRESKGGKKFISGRITPIDEFYTKQPSARPAFEKKKYKDSPAKETIGNDEVPF